MAFGYDDAFLIAMRAAGAIYSIKQAKQQKKMIQMGRDLEQASFEQNMAAVRAQYSQASLDEMRALRENVSQQIVMNAAKGVASGAGSAATNIQKSESIAAQDEKTRRLNLLIKENELRAANVLSGLHTLQSETKLGQSLTNQIFNNLPISSAGNFFKNETSDNAIDAIGTNLGRKFGFGLNPI